VLIPKENWQEIFQTMEGIEVIPVTRLEEVFRHALLASNKQAENIHPISRVDIYPSVSAGV